MTDFLFHYYSVHGDFEVHSQRGGAIASVHSNVTITESLFNGNYAQVGGAIFSELYSNITIINSIFVGNRAILMSSGIDNKCFAGGAVLYARSGSAVAVHSSEFNSNTAEWRGGVILINSDNVAIKINDSKFVDNKALAGAGVVDSSDTTNTVITMSHSDFINNIAHLEGGVLGAANVENITIKFIDSKFVNNEALLFEGGVVYLWGSTNATITVNGSNFNGNMAVNGGCLCSAGDNINVTITISGSIFSNNESYVGGVARIRDGAHVIISESTFQRNHARVSGGVLQFSSAEVEITRSTFISNRAEHLGGIIDTHRGKLTINESQFQNNTAFLAGVVGSEQSNITISESDFICNAADSNGGVLTMNVTILTIVQTSFTNNTARFGGVLWAEQSTVNSHFITFNDNSAKIDGGVCRTKQTNTIISRAKFRSNRDGKNGGSMYTDRGTTNISDSKFDHNIANIEGGVFYIKKTNTTMVRTKFSHNMAGKIGGIMYSDGGTVSISDSKFDHNSADLDGGVFHAKQTDTRVSGTSFSHNRADNKGGVMYTDRGMTSISDSKFDHNTAGNDGGVMRSYLSEMSISGSVFINNRAENEGGVLYTDQSTLNMYQSSFTNNTANAGGIMRADQCTSIINQSSFINNTASTGGVMWTEQTTITSHVVYITNNHANFGTVYLLESTTLWSDITFSDNEGSFLALGGIVTLTENCAVVNNRQPSYRKNIYKLQEGGAITLFQSELNLYGISELMNNYAEDGGALNAIESKLHVNGKTMIANNIATETGGGIHLYHSELNCWRNSTLTIRENSATEKGGGIRAIGSSIKVIGSHDKHSSLLSQLQLVDNKARKGGGLYLEMNSKLYILKLKRISNHHGIVIFTANSAEYGGAVYVSDDGMCSLSFNFTVSECFFQTLAMYSPRSTDSDPNDTVCQNIHFFKNTAKTSGHSLFGGLLDRCTVSPLAEPNINKLNKDFTFSNGTIVVEGHEYFQKISNVQDSDIGSDPVRVCFCRHGQPDCSYQPDPINVKKGEQRQVLLSLAIVDQINHPLKEATVYSHLASGNYLCQNHIQTSDGLCSRVNFSVFSNNDTEELILSVGDGSCQNTPESQSRVVLEFSCNQCPLGFQLDGTRKGCDCVCDSQLFPFFTMCSGETLVRESNVWITHINTNDSSSMYQYLIHPNCPRDYCHPPSSRVEINLNMLNGADAQCANSRSGLLCGICQPGFSLSLGSSSCIPCSTNWLTVMIVIVLAAFLAGIALVVLLLMLNLTVAVGTLNGIIFYANIVAANISTFLPSSKLNFAYVIISWLNLEIGFDICFFEEMDSYWKTLLQLVFPTYIIFLVIVVIIFSEVSIRFAALIGKRNPVSTLASLILFSYTRFLHTIIASLSFAVLDFSDGSRQVVWLPDATVGYLTRKYIALFIIAIFILMAGIPYTILLLFWQWILHYQDKRMFAWMKYQKLHHFIEPYHAPYTFKHRYWTGLLLLARAVLYLVSAVNVMGDPRVTLVAIIFVVGCLLLVKGVFEKRVYRNWPIDIIETITYFNLIAFAACTWYNFDTAKNQTVIAYTSVMITLLLLLSVIIFHVYKYTNLHSTILASKCFKLIRAKMQGHEKEQQKGENADDGVLKQAEDLNTPKQHLPTYTLVEIHIK